MLPAYAGMISKRGRPSSESIRSSKVGSEEQRSANHAYRPCVREEQRLRKQRRKSWKRVPKADTLASMLSVCGYVLAALPADQVPESALVIDPVGTKSSS